ncbi:MAG TPA: V-type ATP synthase subunit F [Euryarchaeota archaeon]|nr:V-type ATP synthase subunit F [Euryarchaeota archaeon]
MMEIAVVGDDEFNMGFMLAGIRKVFDVGEDIEGAFDSAMCDNDVGIIITLDEYYNKLSQRTKLKCEKSNDPVIVVVGKKSDESLKEQIIRTVGVDLWKEQ